MNIIKCLSNEISTKIADIIEKNIKSIKKENIVFALTADDSLSEVFSELIKRNIDWKKVHFFLVDENITKKREELNFDFLFRNLFDPLSKKGKIKKENIHPFIFTGNIDKDLFNYHMDLTRLSFRFDIVLLSAREDGSIASLFPNHPSLKESSMGYIHVKNSPFPPVERISASRNFIQESALAILLFSKRQENLKKLSDKKEGIEGYPAKMIEKIKESYVFNY